MSDAPILSVKPIITYPREAQVGKTYLMTIDLQVEDGFEWQYEEEEYPVYCTVDSESFSNKPVGEPVVVLHRFGGSYGEAKFLLTAMKEELRGDIKITLINRWGVAVKNLNLTGLRITYEIISSALLDSSFDTTTLLSEANLNQSNFFKTESNNQSESIGEVENITYPIHCVGTAKLRIIETGEVFEINSSDLDWETESEDERPMGAELHHYAIYLCESVVESYLAEITWDIWEYPLGTIEGKVHVEVGDGVELLQNFDDFLLYSEFEESVPDDQLELDEITTNFLLDDLRQAYKNLDLCPLLQAEDIKAFYVDYGGETLERLQSAVKSSPFYSKFVFSGHRGCGKTTLLDRFARQICQQGYFVDYFSISEMIEIADVNHVDILYAIALELLSASTRVGTKIPNKAKTDLLKWLVDFELYSIEAKSSQKNSVDLPVNLIYKLKTESAFRQKIRQKCERNLSELILKINEIAALIQITTQKQILIIIDDIDKLDSNLIEDIYGNHARSLFALNVKIIFTVPAPSLQDTKLRATFQEMADSIHHMKLCQFYKYHRNRETNADPDEEKVQVFLEILRKRIPENLVEPEVARQMVLLSGGVPRELIRIARQCVAECLTAFDNNSEQQDTRIDTDTLNKAIRDLRSDYARALGESDYTILTKIYKDFVPGDMAEPEFLYLLQALFVLEYEDDKNRYLWYHIHPIVKDLVKRREQLKFRIETEE